MRPIYPFLTTHDFHKFKAEANCHYICHCHRFYSQLQTHYFKMILQTIVIFRKQIFVFCISNKYVSHGLLETRLFLLI